MEQTDAAPFRLRHYVALAPLNDEWKAAIDEVRGVDADALACASQAEIDP